MANYDELIARAAAALNPPGSMRQALAQHPYQQWMQRGPAIPPDYSQLYPNAMISPPNIPQPGGFDPGASYNALSNPSAPSPLTMLGRLYNMPIDPSAHPFNNYLGAGGLPQTPTAPPQPPFRPTPDRYVPPALQPQTPPPPYRGVIVPGIEAGAERLGNLVQQRVQEAQNFPGRAAERAGQGLDELTQQLGNAGDQMAQIYDQAVASVTSALQAAIDQGQQLPFAETVNLAMATLEGLGIYGEEIGLMAQEIATVALENLQSTVSQGVQSVHQQGMEGLRQLSPETADVAEEVVNYFSSQTGVAHDVLSKGIEEAKNQLLQIAQQMSESGSELTAETAKTLFEKYVANYISADGSMSIEDATSAVTSYLSEYADYIANDPMQLVKGPLRILKTLTDPLEVLTPEGFRRAYRGEDEEAVAQGPSFDLNAALSGPPLGDAGQGSAMLQSLGFGGPVSGVGGGGGGSGQNINLGAVQPLPPPIQEPLPAGPDLLRARADLLKGAPTRQDPQEAMTAAVFQALGSAAQNIDITRPIAENIFKIGMAGIAGLGAGKQAGLNMEREFQRANAAFQREVADLEFDIQQSDANTEELKRQAVVRNLDRKRDAAIVEIERQQAKFLGMTPQGPAFEVVRDGQRQMMLLDTETQLDKLFKRVQIAANLKKAGASGSVVDLASTEMDFSDFGVYAPVARSAYEVVSSGSMDLVLGKEMTNQIREQVRETVARTGDADQDSLAWQKATISAVMTAMMENPDLIGSAAGFSTTAAGLTQRERGAKQRAQPAPEE